MQRGFENHRQVRGMSRFKKLDFPADGQVVGFVCDAIILDCAFRHLVEVGCYLTIGDEGAKIRGLRRHGLHE